ncbi:hypothetical protein [Clostridium sp.]|uniref:hypothetical protein n=1 Tax=Clostridium sp. TaxID=1506 RepID=UPI0025BB7BE2|nr:hypothetical protein [Clostridium sp.]
MAVEKINKEDKEIVTEILSNQGISYEEWINNEQKKLISENSKLIREGLKLLNSKGG